MQHEINTPEKNDQEKKAVRFLRPAAMGVLLALGLCSMASAGTCVKQERYCQETLPDGKCKLWGSREVEVFCGSKNKVCTKEERYCTETLADGKCKLWDSKTVSYPCE